VDESTIIINAHELGTILKDLEQRYAGSIGSALGQISQIMVGQVEDEFQTAGHGKWAPFAASTLKRRLKKGGDPKLLQDTAIAAGSVFPLVEADAAVAYTNVPYMIFHTSQEPRRVIPYRNPFDIDDDELLSQATDIILTALARSAA